MREQEKLGTATKRRNSHAFGARHVNTIEIPDSGHCFDAHDQDNDPALGNFLVKYIDNMYPASMFHPDKALLDYIISQGIDESEARELLPLAERAISELCQRFKGAARVPKVTALPEIAPELFKGNKGNSENIIEFLRRVWKHYIDEGLMSRRDLKRLDGKAYVAVLNWISTKGPLPQDVAIPTRSDVVNTKFKIGDLTREVMEAKMRESERLASALRRRLEAS
jgi:hypothetical protein